MNRLLWVLMATLTVGWTTTDMGDTKVSWLVIASIGTFASDAWAWRGEVPLDRKAQ